MGEEDLTGTKYIDDLNELWPLGSDDPVKGDDHIRGIKNVLVDSFPGITGAVTATHTELNLIDGVTSTTAELNILDGVTSTAAELNILDGVTSTAAELNILDGVTSTAAELNLLDGVTSVAFSNSYTSAEQTITAAGQLVLAHSLAAMPTLVQLRLVCKTADLNYAQDDEVIISPNMNASTTGRGASVVVDSTNVTIRYGNGDGTFYLFDKTTGIGTAITNAKWKMVVRAWK